MAKILVIDDSRLIAHVAKNMLTAREHEVSVATNGEEGLEAVANIKPDLILLDLIMPGMDGYAVCEKIKGSPATADIPVIMLTSKAETADKVKGLEAGASDYVTKPFEEGELVARVNTHLRIKDLYESLQETNRQLQELANRDGLTGLYNHRYFQDAMTKDFQRAMRYHESLSCVLCDIDYFKKFNDTYGHQTGDIVLSTLARIIEDSLRDTDLAARYGGEEFALVLYHTPAAAAFMVAERLRDSVEKHEFIANDLSLSVTISVGVATFPHPDIPDHKTLIECADKALYKAKENGRNQVISF
ncbi:MAG: PleD family two-component system response regulator [Desulfatibacillum sp.]|nr:PleD family two-component system response regulator [Desulfatibacillum sp.]